MLLVFLSMGMPVFASLGISSIIGILLLGGISGLNAIPDIFIEKLDNFVLVSIPLYILMGEIVFKSGMGSDLYAVANRFTGKIPGGLAVSTVIASAIFGAMCGVSIAGAATIGSAAIPEMIERGYSKRLASGSVAAAGALSLLIPPSIGFILYGAVADASVGSLFTAGIVPGIILSIMMIVYIVLSVIANPGIAPKTGKKISLNDKNQSMMTIFPAIILIIAVLGSIYLGVATPTESAAIGSLGAFIIAVFIRKVMNIKLFIEIIYASMRTTGMILLIFVNAMLFGYLLTRLQIPRQMASYVVSMNMNKSVVLFAVTILLILLGMFLDGASVILIATPILLPLITSLGYSKLWFGVIMMITVEMAVITPPIGLNLYVIKSVSPPSIRLNDIVAGAFPFVIVELVAILLFMIFPQIVLWLPVG